MTRRRSILWLVMVNVVVTVVLAEVVLRAQQKIGPLYDLDIHPQSMLIDASDELNHVHPPGPDWDRNGIRRMEEPNSESCAPRLLFLGDSFMEGLGASDTIPYHVRNTLRRIRGKDVCVFNAGASSYSPSIFVVQAKKLIPLLKPDLVIVDVDETDIYDEWYRYRHLAIRDDAGSIIAVRHTPLTSEFQRGLLESTDKTLYLSRFIAKLYFTGIKYPRIYAESMKNKIIPVFMSDLSESEVRTAHADEIAYFASSLDDLTHSILRLTGSPDKLVYIHHPHLPHLKASGQRYNNIVSETLREVASRHGVRYYDATDDLKERFGSEPERYYIPNDPHFNQAGARVYSIAVAEHLVEMLTR
jgi:hypothetical protein